MKPRETRRQDQVGGVRIHVRTAATDPTLPPLVMVHGFVISSRYLMPNARELAGRFHVLAPDLPGFGLSDKPPRALDVAELADALALWMETAGPGPAPVLGHSFGCQVVVELAARHPRLVPRCVLVSPTMDPSADAWGQAAHLLRDVPRESPMVWLEHVPDYAHAGLRRAAATYRHALAHPMRERLPHVRAPTLVVRGTRDPVVSRGWAREVATRLPHGRLEEIPGAHVLNYTYPDRLARCVAPFLLASA